MCGLAGVKKFGDTTITEEELSILLCALENRGNHATGVALQNDDSPDKVFVFKKDVPAWSFIADDDYRKFMKEHLLPTTRTAILHTRAATTGAPYKNENNHPIFMGMTAIAHNGMISNSDRLFNQHEYKRSCETDSDIIRAILDDKGLTKEGVKELSQMSGSAAIAAVRADSPNELLLARSGNPIIYADYNDKLYWASELHAIQKAVRPWVKKHGLFMRRTVADISYLSMPDNTAYLFGQNGVEWKQEFNVCNNFHPVTYRVNDSYYQKKRDWNARKIREDKTTSIIKTLNTEEFYDSSTGYCPKCHIKVHKTKSTEAWSTYYCWKCKAGLAELDS